jgi:hypothetical protein
VEAPGWDPMGNLFKRAEHVSGIWQITGDNHRLLGFRDDDNLVLVCGFKKGTPNQQREEIRRAAEYREAYQRDQKKGETR